MGCGASKPEAAGQPVQSLKKEAGGAPQNLAVPSDAENGCSKPMRPAESRDVQATDQVEPAKPIQANDDPIDKDAAEVLAAASRHAFTEAEAPAAGGLSPASRKLLLQASDVPKQSESGGPAFFQRAMSVPGPQNLRTQQEDEVSRAMLCAPHFSFSGLRSHTDLQHFPLSGPVGCRRHAIAGYAESQTAECR